MGKLTVALTVNGRAVSEEVAPTRLLSELLRDDLLLTGTKRGCETGTCGACTVIRDGVAVKSCLSLAVQARGATITTIEGLAQGTALHPLQAAFMTHGGLQCGYCTPGMIMAALALLHETPRPTEAEVREGLGGNLCRCTGYDGIVRAVLAAAEAMDGA
jgi:aerobic carbon-monoxide dehydrogenase small subunit